MVEKALDSKPALIVFQILRFKTSQRQEYAGIFQWWVSRFLSGCQQAKLPADYSTNKTKYDQQGNRDNQYRIAENFVRSSFALCRMFL